MALVCAVGPAADLQSVEAGAVLYRENCAACHAANLEGGEAPNLFRSRVVVAGSPQALAGLIRKGIPGTGMPPYPWPDEQLRQLVTFLHSTTRPGAGPPLPGDPEAGRAVFEKAGCAACHMIGGKGGALGPDLSSIALRSFPARIRQSVVDPGASIAAGYAKATLTLRDGRVLTGALRNEDNFSLQLLLPNGEYALLHRADIRQVRSSGESPMPKPDLTPDDLRDLLAYLDRQRAPFLSFSLTFQNY